VGGEKKGRCGEYFIDICRINRDEQSQCNNMLMRMFTTC